ncbi:ABC transporter permease [Chromobacterium haemolyticum]|uniref:ABC transporter permease n=1 Tax=Chromobacterium fluminis TaxID=3044269 RepID=A0ABX0LCB2_9NEIS|nr:ABC transporter permease [Chromobacterium haemolyticum]NHR06030.1 ABC transporter permease [Chromobacterium haemolyticum]OQS33585.1 amino acid ABC transporter permease [Chromobacterium haemolyticum]
MIDFQLILDKLPAFFGGGDGNAVMSTRDGLLMTLELLFISLALGMAMAVPMALMQVSKNRLASGAVRVYGYVFRGTPLLVQLFIIYYGLAQFGWVRDSWAWNYLQEAYFCAILAFTLNTAAYTTEIIAGQIRNTHWGEIEAAQAMGMSKWLMMRRIVLPSALRRALPAYSNEVIMMLQSTAIAGLVTLADITGVARRIYADSYMAFEPFLTAGAIYLALTFLLVWLMKQAEKRWLAYLAPRKH